MWTDRRVLHEDVELAWVEQGEGPVVIFLSGGPGDGATYLRPLAEPVSREWRCVVPDLRGTGGSRLIAADAPLTIDALFEDLDRLRLEAGVDCVALVGHSFGATLALLYAAARPGAVSGAALVGLGPLDDAAADQARTRLVAALSPDRRTGWATARSRRRAAFERGDAEAFRHAFLAQMEIAMPAFVVDVDAGRRLIEARRQAFDHNPAVHAALVADLASVDQWAAVDRLRTPVLVLYGEQDFEPIAQAELIAERAGQVDVLVLPGAAHLPWIDRPAAVTDALLTFLRGLRDLMSPELESGR